MIDRNEAERLLLEERHFDQRRGDRPGGGRRSESFVALREATITDRALAVTHPGDLISNAPTASHGEDLTIDEEDQLFDHYRVPIDGMQPVVAHLGTVLSTDSENTDVDMVNQSG